MVRCVCGSYIAILKVDLYHRESLPSQYPSCLGREISDGFDVVEGSHLLLLITRLLNSQIIYLQRPLHYTRAWRRMFISTLQSRLCFLQDVWNACRKRSYCRCFISPSSVSVFCFLMITSIKSAISKKKILHYG